MRQIIDQDHLSLRLRLDLGMVQLSPQAQANYSILRECICEPLVQKSATVGSDGAKRKGKGKARRKGRLESREKLSSDPEDLADFIDVQT